MSTLVKWILIVLAIGAAVAAWYFLWYLPSQGPSSSGPQNGDPCIINPNPAVRNRQGVWQNGVCVPVDNTSNRMTAIQANGIINNYAIKDTLGYPTINFNGDFSKPNVSNYPGSALQNLLKNGWWFALLQSNPNLPDYDKGDNGNYLVAIYDLRDSSATINNGKSQIAIPPALQPYITL